MTKLPQDIDRRRRRKPGHRPRRHHGGHRHTVPGRTPGLGQSMQIDLRLGGGPADEALATVVLMRSGGMALSRAKEKLGILRTIDSDRQVLRLGVPLVADWRALRNELMGCGVVAELAAGEVDSNR